MQTQLFSDDFGFKDVPDHCNDKIDEKQAQAGLIIPLKQSDDRPRES